MEKQCEAVDGTSGLVEICSKVFGEGCGRYRLRSNGICCMSCYTQTYFGMVMISGEEKQEQKSGNLACVE